MTDIITGPAEYRTKEGKLKKIIGRGGSNDTWMSGCGSIYGNHGLCLGKDGHFDPLSYWQTDMIVGPWQERPAEPERQGFEPFWVVIQLPERIVCTRDGAELYELSKLEAEQRAVELAQSYPDETFFVCKAQKQYTASVTVTVRNAKEQPE